MGYLSKKAILKAYECLSHLSENPNLQGATQKVSAIRHFLALDSFFKTNGKDCNTRMPSDKKDFADRVGKVCEVCLDLYTPNFYYPLKKHNGDFSVGSNFYSAGQVNSSLVNPATTFDYPKRGNTPLFKIKNGVLIRDIELYKNFNNYVEEPKFMVALIIWLLRKTNISQTKGKSLFDCIHDSVSNKFTPELVAVMFENADDLEKNLELYDSTLNDNFYSIREEDINSLFVMKEEIQREIFTNKNNLKPSNLKFLTAIRTKPFILLAGISGTGKSRIVRKLAQATDTIDEFESEEERWNCHRPKNFELIQVKPNWHNSMDVVGYFSNVSGSYSFTPFVEFLAKAWQHKDVPFFLCLDEMNLAPVEEYFAEFLSAVESRTIDNEGNYWTDPIIKPFKEFGDGVCSQMNVHLLGDTPDNDLAKQFNEKGLTLPPNLIVMGTVNMDETTFSFSRKVLDRAMSIEMNDVDYDKFLTGETENDIPVLTEQNELLVERPIKALDVKDEVDSERIIEYLKAINQKLDNTPFKLGYRAANEAILYVAAAKAWGNDDLESSLDQFTLMKILSRIEGDESKLMADDEHTILESLREVITEHLGDGERQSVKKIDEMKKVLLRDHFVSYWS